MCRTPERGMSTSPPPLHPQRPGLRALMRAQRRARSFLAAFFTSTTVIGRRIMKKKVITLFDLVLAGQSKQDTI